MSSLVDALDSDAPAGDREAAMMLYGQFVGSWDGTIVVHEPDGNDRESSCEVHFGWVLAGRAVQDVWIAPARDTRAAGAVYRMYGTTLRVYDPETNAWDITWIDPVNHAFNRMTGRAVGEEIVQEYHSDSRGRCQWTFTEITQDSFHWISRESRNDGDTWNVSVEFFLHRRAIGKSTGQPPAAPSDNASPERAFDFWIGDWIVTDPETGETLGTNRVQSILGGNVLQENWSGADGVEGQSLNIYDAQGRVWHQTWVSQAGSLLQIDGGLRDGVMQLEGARPTGPRQRIRWSPQADGTVMQHWETSEDDSLSWTTRFKGLYQRTCARGHRVGRFA